MIHCVTTMNKEYYDSIGKVMIRSWLKSFPSTYCLHLFLEDFKLDITDPRIIIEDFSEVQDLWNVWWEKRGSNNDRHKKFTFKACSQIAIWNKLKEGKFIWLDADLIFLKEVPDNMFDRVLENYPLASWGDYSFESGTVFVNLSHPDWPKILHCYKEIYVGDRGLPEGEKWFDGELLGRAVKDSGVLYNNLNKLCTAKTNTPLNHSWLGEYMIHFKAKRKNMLIDTLKNDWKRFDLLEMLENE